MTYPSVPMPAVAADVPGHALAPAAMSPDSPTWTETLLDGTSVLVRPIRREDAALERRFINRLSPESRRLRFLGSIGEPGDALIRSLTDIDYQHDVAFIALLQGNDSESEIGVSRFSVGADGQTCECAVTVADEWRAKGLGTLLMRHLIDVARARGMRRMISLDAANNPAMRDLARYLGFFRTTDPDDSTQVIHTLAL